MISPPLLPGVLRVSFIATYPLTWRVLRTGTYAQCKGGSGDILLMAPSQPVPVNVHCGIGTASGNVNEDVTTSAVHEFSVTLKDALSANSPSINLSAGELRRLVERIIGNLTVSPAMGVLLEHNVAPAMFQPRCESHS